MESPQQEYKERSLLGERKTKQQLGGYSDPFLLWSLLGNSPFYHPPSWKEAEGSFCWSLLPFAQLLLP